MIAKNCRAVLGDDLSFFKLYILLKSFEKCLSYAFLAFLYSALTVSDSKHQRITHSGLFWSVNVCIYGSICESVANGYFAWVKLCLYVYVLAELHCILCPNGPAKYLNLTLSSLIYCCLHSPYWKKSTNLGRPICILYKLTAQCERLLIIKFLIF